MTKYWYKTCDVCGQGRLFVMKRQNEERLFLLCEECESAWNAPIEVGDVTKNMSINGLLFGFADAEDIERAGWDRDSMRRAER